MLKGLWCGAYISQSDSKVRATGYETEEYFFREMAYTTDLRLENGNSKGKQKSCHFEKTIRSREKEDHCKN